MQWSACDDCGGRCPLASPSIGTPRMTDKFFFDITVVIYVVSEVDARTSTPKRSS
jgi:hypothetical protein